MAGSMCWYLSSANMGLHSSRKAGAKPAGPDVACEKMSSTPSCASGKAASRILMRRRLALSLSHCAPFALSGSRKLLRRLRKVLPRPARSGESVAPDISVVWMVRQQPIQIGRVEVFSFALQNYLPIAARWSSSRRVRLLCATGILKPED